MEFTEDLIFHDGLDLSISQYVEYHAIEWPQTAHFRGLLYRDRHGIFRAGRLGKGRFTRA
jgi:hypothetical protein